MIRKLLVAIAALTVAAALAGCGEKQTTAKQVANPPEKVPPIARPTPRTEPDAAPNVPKAPPPLPKGWIRTASSLEYKDKKVGKGPAAKSGDAVTVHYKGWLDNGTVFDTSRKAGRGPFPFTLGSGAVIPGWDEGVAGMKVGGVRELKVPPKLGYADQEMGTIPPNSTLHFEVELLKIGGTPS